MSSEESARLVATLWALGGLNLVKGELPLPPREPATPAPALESVEAPEPVFEPILIPEADPEPILLIDEGDYPLPPAHTPPSLPPPPLETAEQVFLEPTPSTMPLLHSAADEESLPAAERAHHLLVKAKSYVMQNRTSEAIRALEQSIKLEGDSPVAYETWLLLGRLRLGNPAWATRAVEALQVASRIRPRAAEPWALMGELYHRKGFQANAQGCFRRALELDPSVAVPSDLSAMSDPDGPRNEGGIMGRLRAMLGREKN
jgi:tetratricopeptide (TPR) repeat protein